AALPPDKGWAALIVAGCLGQWAVAFSFTGFPLLPAWNNTDLEESIGDVGSNEFLTAMVFAILGAAIVPIRGLIALGGIGLIVGQIARSIFRTFCGLNVYFGYALGYIGEIVALAVFAVR